jgi:hypothetical protein
MCCSSTQNGWCCNASGQCFPWHKPLVSKSGDVYTCDYSSGVDVTGVESNCNACPEREITVTDSTSRCVLKCPKDTPLRAADGRCFACSEPESINTGAGAAKCSNICPNRVNAGAWGLNCSLPCGENQFFGNNGGCYSCDLTANVNVAGTESECGQCTNRILSGSMCVLECPEGQIRGNDELCHTCEETDPFSTGNIGSVCKTTCPNRVANGLYSEYCSLPCKENEFTAKNGTCHSCDENEAIDVYAVLHTGCDVCKNRTAVDTGSAQVWCILNCKENEFRGLDGNCYSCTEEQSINVKHKNVCNVCPNRDSLEGWPTFWCALRCAEGTFLTYDGNCYDCSIEENKYATKEQCSRCSETRNFFTGNLCVPKCPAETPLRGSDNECYACDDPTRVPVGGMTDACYECPDERKLDGNYCVLK